MSVPSGKRIKGIRAAAEKASIQLDIVDYAQVIHHPEVLIDALRPESWLKIDSPGEDISVQKHFIEQGWALQQHPQRALTSSIDFGELMATDDWFHGFTDFLKRLEQQVAHRHPTVRWLNSVHDILLMIDKWQTQHHLHQHHTPMPPLLGRIHNYADFKAILQNHPQEGKIFIKPRYGSSASGIIAYQRSRQGHQQAISTTRFDGEKAFNNKRPSRYTKEKDIEKLINHIAQYDAYVESWIPKPSTRLHGKSLAFDFRVVMLAGEPQHTIARASALPMTNLHLDSERVDPSTISKLYNKVALHDVLIHAAQAFPGAKIIGFDVISTPEKTWVLEANAFGDLLLNLTFQNQTPYETQLGYILQQEHTYA
ncbi:MAG: STM4014 family protein [Saezia sp.]